jgi:hypothetical protein
MSFNSLGLFALASTDVDNFSGTTPESGIVYPIHGTLRLATYLRDAFMPLFGKS